MKTNTNDTTIEQLTAYIESAISFLKTDDGTPEFFSSSRMDRVIAYQDVLDTIKELTKL
jgi:hypothetical protein